MTTVQHLRETEHVKAVYVLAIAYQRGGEWHAAPDMWESLSVPNLSAPGGYRLHVHARRFPLVDLPRDDVALAKWLEQRWLEMGEGLERTRVEWQDTRPVKA